MIYRVLADITVLVHSLWVGFIIFGALWGRRNRTARIAHLSGLGLAVLLNLIGVYCPLTYLEVDLRRMGGEAGYSGGFVEHYLLPILYPTGLTRGLQLFLGALVIVVNCGVYGWWLWTRRRERLAGG